ncbi:hypothetical protein GQ43DRAFT_376068 [Delitschia confertaspora ATCC 74209]|uniref:Small secreted protein n=1 Tax=Delitschia confertaspora ATCC 74209 TaxID=1513339 RepID=A0A9P4MTX8_9PLEO|nr:hypothetical protein GQ43DRAFT_376068 [Delitschia confertaspora ATCC 74209]
MRFIYLLSAVLPLAGNSLATSDSDGTYLTATALVTKNNNSAFECWRLTESFKRSSVPGVSGTQVATIGNFSNLAYTVLPPRYNGGLHNAPTPQLVHFISGMVHLTLPHNDSVDAWLLGGVGGLLFATDIEGTGHITTYPSDQTTVAITAPFEGGRIPGHVVLAEGPCVGKQTFI